MDSNKKKLIENFFSLSVLQIGNFLLPLIAFPYLVRVLGPEKYGLITFALAFVQYFALLIDYGFNYTATREIAVNRDDKDKTSSIFSTVLVIKFSLFIIGLTIFSAIIFVFDKFRQEYLLFYFSFGIVFSNFLLPSWFFQGIEKMKYITVLQLLGRVIYTASIFLFIKNVSDYILVPLLNTAGVIISGIIAIIIVLKKFKLKLILPSISSIKIELKNGWHMFLSSLSTNVYKSVDIIFLGLLTSDLILGYYSISKKVIEMVNQFSSVISQTIYPQINIRIRESLPNTIKFLKKVVAIITMATVFMGIAFVLFPEFIIYLVSGDVFEVSVISLMLLAFVPVIIGFSVPPLQILIGSNLDKKVSIILSLGALLAIICNITLITSFSYWGAGFSVLIVELFVMGTLYFVVKKNYNQIQLQLSNE